jgi:glycosyltransferase involved in cell wall biosynthesis
MKIAIEAQRIFRYDKHGMDYVALETIRSLQQIDKVNEYYIIVKPGEDRCVKETNNFHIIELSCPTYVLWEQVALPYCLNRIKPDLLHCTSNTAPLFSRFSLYLTLHDIIFLEKRKGSNHSLYQRLGRIYRSWIVPRIISKCTLIITVSEFERENILHSLSLHPQSVKTIHNGLSAAFHPSKKNTDIVRKYIPEEPYLFFLGNTDPKKNTPNTLKAYGIYLHKSKRKLPLLIADLNETVIDDILAKEGLSHIKSNFYFPGYIPNGDLPAVYTGAFAFLYPSLRESFGLPLLEAMASGIPVISSNTSAIPEIAGEGALLVDPNNPESIAQMIVDLEDKSDLYDNQVAYGLDRSRNYSWEQTARNLLTNYLTLNAENDVCRNN